MRQQVHRPQPLDFLPHRQRLRILVLFDQRLPLVLQHLAFLRRLLVISPPRDLRFAPGLKFIRELGFTFMQDVLENFILGVPEPIFVHHPQDRLVAVGLLDELANPARLGISQLPIDRLPWPHECPRQLVDRKQMVLADSVVQHRHPFPPQRRVFLLHRQALCKPVGNAVVGRAQRYGVREFMPRHLAEIKRPRRALPSARAHSAMIRPVLAPTVGSHGPPVVRTANSSCVGKTSISVFTFGSN